MKVTIYIEGGGDSRELQARCREGFRELFNSLGFARSPRLVAGGSRNRTLKDFKKALRTEPTDVFVSILVDSEDPVADLEEPWKHLEQRDGADWKKPECASDEQALLMVTCMETWICADRGTLTKHYKDLQESALPSEHNLEKQGRKQIYERLERATRKCSNAYEKGVRSFEILGRLSPDALRKLPSFARTERILKEKLG